MIDMDVIQISVIHDNLVIIKCHQKSDIPCHMIKMTIFIVLDGMSYR